jgi:hypothetical protein
MSGKQHRSLTASCQCGAVVLEVAGAPIVHTACYCASCQEAGRRIEQLPDAPTILDADGGTDCVYRKDRVRCVQGGERLEAHWLKPGSPTRRMVAACCNSAMFLDFTKGHWLTFYRARLPGSVPPLEMRVMTADRREGAVLPEDVPNYAAYAGKFMWRLLAAWVQMGLRTPKVTAPAISLSAFTATHRSRLIYLIAGQSRGYFRVNLSPRRSSGGLLSGRFCRPGKARRASAPPASTAPRSR